MSDLSRRISHLSAVKLAFAAEQLEAQIDLMQAEPMAIIGLACRFPGGAHDPDAFWSLLKNGSDAIREVPADRWDIDALYDPDPRAPGKMSCRHGGFLERADLFDADFFGISPREAESMDPQQRLLLEVSWEAIEQAHQPAERLFGSATGVFVGISTFDYAALQAGLRDRAAIDAYQVSGTTLSVAAGRLSYLLGLTGPCLSVDTACSSSLVSLHLACQSLRNRECDRALAAGVGLLLAPEPFINFSKAGMLARDGRCKTFDAAADGYVRGEGCGVAVLKRLGDALADGDRVWAIVRGSAVNQDGASGGLTVPSGPSQEAVIRQALAGAGLEAHQVSYVECHGTGTSQGDPIEINALAAALCRDRTADRPLIVGSVKTNIGHLEAAAGIAGVIKVVLALRHRLIPAHLHFRSPNPRIAWAGMPISVASPGRPWLPAEGRRIAGVSAFGFSGTNAHCILEEAPEERPVTGGSGRPLHLLTLSAKTEEALDRLVEQYRHHLDAHPEQEIGDLCHTANRGRTLFSHRLAVVAGTRQELRETLGMVPRLGGERLSADVQRSGPVRERETVRFDSREAAKDLRQELRRLARVHAEGGRIDWDDFTAGAGYRMVSLPTYPFLRERFWFDASGGSGRTVGQAGADPGTRGEELIRFPLPGRRLPLPLSSEIRFESAFGSRSPALLEDHRLFGLVVVAGATWLAMVLEAIRQGLSREDVRLEGVLFERALTIAEGEKREVQTVLLPDAEGSFAFQVLSRAAGQGGHGIWESHVRGKIRISGGNEEAAAPPRARAAALREEAQKSWEEVACAAFYGEISGAGHHLGASFRRIRRIWKQGREALCLLEAPVRQEDAEFPLSPGLIDSCFQFFCIRGRSLWEGGAEGTPPDPDATYIPFTLEEVWFCGLPEPGGRLWCHVQIRSFDPLTQGMTGAICLFDEGGGTLLKMEGLTARRLERRALSGRKGKSAEAASFPGARPLTPHPQKSAILLSLEQAPAGLRRAILQEYLRDQVAATLRLTSLRRITVDRGLFEMGIDSLMALELKNRFETDLGRPLRPTLVFDYPSVEALTGALAEELSLPADDGPEAPGSGTGKATHVPQADVDDAIAAELAQLETLLKGR